MRPITLQVQGFGAFRESMEVDFDGVNLFALVGNTGSGKSTIIDAMCFALYGSVPRYDDLRAVAPAITTGASRARVSLTFSVGAKTYIATRIVERTRNGGATTKEARLERLSSGGDESTVLAGTPAELTSHVERILGLTFDHFTRCVVLPQGAFARFLHDKPSERNDLLVQLLDLGLYGRMRAAVVQRVATAEAEVRLSEGQLKHVADCTPEALSSAKALGKALDELRSKFADAATEIEQLQDTSKAALRRAAEAAHLVSALDSIAVPESVISQDSVITELETKLIAALKNESATSAAIAEIEGKVESLPTAQALSTFASSHAELAKCSADLQIATGALDAAIKTTQAAEEERSLAQTAAEDARLRVERIRQTLAAEDIAQHLTIGEPCPVCLRNVTDKPNHVEHASLKEASQFLKKAEEAQSKAAAAQTNSAKLQSAAEQRVSDLTARVSVLTEVVSEYSDPLALDALITRVEAQAKSLAEARTQQTKDHEAARLLERSLSDAKDILKEGQQEFHGQRNPVTSLNPPSPAGELAKDWHSLSEWALQQLPLQRKAEAENTKAAQEATSRATKLFSTFGKSAAKSGVTIDETSNSVSDLRDAITEATTESRSEIANIESGVLEQKRLQKVLDAALETQKVGTELAKLLSSSHFERWLVAEALQTLVVGASQTLKRLSGGSYSLTCNDKGDFLVVDHFNADEERSVKTLSGGETFQASLALALALADHLVNLAAQGAARLESMFLDEGFGTLDSDTLNTVADTIESLGTDERMVGIVTHVKELADRVPVRYAVTKAGRTSTVERINA